MKKLFILTSLILLFSGVSFAGDLNVKIGLDVFGSMKYDGRGGWDDSDSAKVGVSLVAEYLANISDMVKLGGGLQYLLPREVDTGNDPDFYYIPIYATIQVYPFKELQEIFFKGNLGYNLKFDYDQSGIDDTKGKMYWGLGLGYEFDFGLVIDGMYEFFYSNFEALYNVDVRYSKLGIHVGYRFSL